VGVGVGVVGVAVGVAVVVAVAVAVAVEVGRGRVSRGVGVAGAVAAGGCDDDRVAVLAEADGAAAWGGAAPAAGALAEDGTPVDAPLASPVSPAAGLLAAPAAEPDPAAT
jgi:hypothetical protein